MKHYGIAEWVDFARQLATPEEREHMQSHLDAGCAECRNIAEFCAGVSRVAAGMAACEAPESVVRCARAIFPVRPRPERKRVIRIPLELIFDSFLVPAPAGLRSTWQIGWQALYRAGDCSVDLRIEPELRSSRAALIGQVSNHAVPGSEMSNTAVCLKSGRQVVAQTVSNKFGEFQIEYEQKGRMQLCLYVDGGSKCILVPLKKLMSNKPGAADRLSRGVPRRKPNDKQN